MTQQIWSEDEVTYLKGNVGNLSATEIGDKLGRSKNSVVHKIRKLGLHGLNQGKHAKWTPEQREALRTTANAMTTQQFATKHGLTFQSVRHWARKLNIRFIKYSEPWSDMELSILREHKITSIIQDMTGRSRDAVQRKAKLLGIVLEEARGPKPKKAPVECISKVYPVKPSRVGKKVKAERSQIEYCPNCSSPVANWQQHFDRMPQCRVVRKQA